MDEKLLNQKKEPQILEGGSDPKRVQRVKRKAKRKIPGIEQLLRMVNSRIMGQEDAVKRILISIYRSLKMPKMKSNILIIGPSGVGKTESLKCIARFLNIPYTIEDATKFTKEGYHGADVTEMIADLYFAANKDIKRAERGMIIIDEIDKKCTGDSNDISGREVLKSLLKLIEGEKCLISEELDDYAEWTPKFLDTSKLIIVCLGAFSGIDKIREKRLKHTGGIGFSTGEKPRTLMEEDTRYTKEDIIKYGMPEEFAGRLNTIIEFNQLEKNDLVKILKDSKLSVFKKYDEYLRNNGILLKVPDNIFEEIVNKAFCTQTGARELSSVVNELFDNILYEVFSHPKGTYTKCTIESGITTNPNAFKLE